jgi:hypothetical protein
MICHDVLSHARLSQGIAMPFGHAIALQLSTTSSLGFYTYSGS